MLATPGCTAAVGTVGRRLFGRSGQVVARPGRQAGGCRRGCGRWSPPPGQHRHPTSSLALLVVALEPLSKPRSPIKSLLFGSRCCRGCSCEGWSWGERRGCPELAAASELAPAPALPAGPPWDVGCAGLSAPCADPQKKTLHRVGSAGCVLLAVGGHKALRGAEPCGPPAGRALPQLPPSPLQSAPLPTRGLSLTFPSEPCLINVAFSACFYTWEKLGSFLSACPCPTWCCRSPNAALGRPILPLRGLFTTGSRGLGARVSLLRWPCKSLLLAAAPEQSSGPGRICHRAVPCRAGTSPGPCLWWHRWALAPRAPVRSGGSGCGAVTHEPPGHGLRRCLCQKPGDFNAIRCHLILHNSCCLIR